MTQQAGGRIVAVMFLSSLVATAGLGLVGHAQHSGDPSTLDVPRLPEGRVNRDGARHRSGPAHPTLPLPSVPSGQPAQRTASARPTPAPTAARPASGDAPVPSLRPAVLVAAPAGEPPAPLAAPPADFRIEAADAAPLLPPAASLDGRTMGIVLVQHSSADAPAALVVPLAESGPATEPRSLRADERGPDADSIDWSEAATGLIPPLESSSGARRGPVANWIRDSLDDIKASRGGVVNFPQRQASAPAGGRLIDRIRSGERLLSRERADRQNLRGPQASDPSVATRHWPVPTSLLQPLDQLATADRGPAAVWANECAAVIRRVMATDGPHDPAAVEPLDALRTLVERGTTLANATPDAAATIRRAALAVQRRQVTWNAVRTAAAAIEPAEGAATPDHDSSAGERIAACLPPLLEHLERYEASPTPTDAAACARMLDSLDACGIPEAVAVAEAVRSQYVAANIRVAVHQKFMERMLPPTQVTNAAVDDTVLGRQVRGTSRVAQSTAVHFTPDADGISVILEVRGDVASRTVTESGPVALTSRGSSWFTVRKPLSVDQAGLQLGKASGSAASRSQLADIQTSFDGVPIMRSLVRNIARNQHDEHLPEANREVIDKIVSRACREVDQQVEPQLLQAAERIRTQAWGPLVKLGLEPTPVSLETNGGIAMARLRLAAEDQFAAHTPRPRAPLGSMLSVQVHESAVNNALERLGLAGRRLALEELVELLCDRAGVEPQVPEDLPEDVAVTFAAVQPLRIQYRDGVVQVRVALDAIESGRRSWHDIVASVTYRPKAEGQQLYLEREGPVQLGGPGHQGRAEIALRAVFGKIFPKDRPLPLLPETLVTNPRLTDMKVLQAVSTDGWLAISLGELPESVVHSPAKVAAPLPSPTRRILRK